MNWPDRRLPFGQVVGQVVGLGLVLGLVAAACGEGGAGSSDAVATAAPSTTAQSAAGSTHSPIVVDARLLEILPAQIDGIDMQPMPETAAGMLADPTLGSSASAIAVGLVAAGELAPGDFAVSSVIRLRPGVNTDDFYLEWRLDYDEAACEVAGGVSSHAQPVIGGHTVEVAVCAQGARTYHVRLADDVLVSVTAVGDRRFGDLVMAGLRE